MANTECYIFTTDNLNKNENHGLQWLKRGRIRKLLSANLLYEWYYPKFK